MASTEDSLANKVLQECCQDIVDHIDVDEVILRLYSKGKLTLQEFERLENIYTQRDKKRQPYRIALADKGRAAFEDILEVLNDTAGYKPHADLVDILRKRHRLVSTRVSRCMTHDQAGEAGTAVIQKSEEDQLPDIVRIETASQTGQLHALLVEPKVEQNISVPTTVVSHNQVTGYGGPAPSAFLSLSVGSLMSVTQLSSSIQSFSDTTPYPPVKV